jgi:hypothetical protein
VVNAKDLRANGLFELAQLCLVRPVGRVGGPDQAV